MSQSRDNDDPMAKKGETPEAGSEAVAGKEPEATESAAETAQAGEADRGAAEPVSGETTAEETAADTPPEGEAGAEDTAREDLKGAAEEREDDPAADALEDPALEDPEPEEPRRDHHEEHHLEEVDGGIAGPTFAAMALRFLIIVLVVFGLSLWLVPMMAPHLPATIARHIMPGQKDLDERLAGLDAQVRARTASALEDVSRMRREVETLTARLAEAEATAARAREQAAAARDAAEASAKAAVTASVAEEVVVKAEESARLAAEAAETATTAATEAGKVAAAATRDTASLARRMTSFDARVTALTEELGALSESLANAPGPDEGGPTPELVAAFTALKTRVDTLAEQMADSAKYLTNEDMDRFATQDDLRSARTALQAEIKSEIGRLPAPEEIATGDDLAALGKELGTRLDTLGARVSAAEKNAEAASAAAAAAETASRSAEGKVETAILDASVRSAIAALTSRLQNGASFGGALSELERLTGVAAPGELSGPAENGVATTAALLRTFGRSAQAAISADIRAGAEDEGVLGKASARLRSVVAGRPKNEQTGDNTGAIVSRIEARLRDGALAEALAEAEALSPAAREAMSAWLTRLEARVAAESAASAYIDELMRQQG